MSRGSMLAVAGCFLLSGFAALIYQTAWTREFAFVFGTSELAVATVLAAYMGGLAAGSAVAGRLVHRVTRPVLTYGVLEGAIALCAFGVPVALRGATALYVGAFGGQPDPPAAGEGALAVYTLLASMLILLVPTGLMGATLPLLIRHVVDRDEVVGSRVGLLYAINTLGAVFGTVLAGFVLMPTLGLRGTLLVAVATNGLVFALAAFVARGERRLEAERTPPRPSRGLHWILPVMTVSGFVSFGYEVLWFKLLVHLVGASVHAFSTMLASFLIGIAGGSTVASRLARSRAAARRGFALAQIGTALASLLAYFVLDALPGLAESLEGAGGRRLVDVGLSVLVLLPSTLCIGATFPFAVRILARDEAEAGAATARVYAWNTLGAIAGAVGTGFVLLPALGFPGMLALLLASGLVLALATALVAPPRALPVAAAAGLGLLAVLLVQPEPPWTLLRTGALARAPRGGEIVFHEVGRSTTVLVRHEGASYVVSTSGLPESSIGGPLLRPGKSAVARWLGALGPLARPEGTSMLMVGLGGGVAIEVVPRTVERIDVVELEPAVVRANRFVSPLRGRDPLADPRVRVIENDARAAMELTERRYSVVASQPSHPWTAGASHLYTREFFALARERLEPGGVFVQWMGLQFIDVELLRVLLATLLDTFDYVRVYQPAASPGIEFVASDAPLDLAASAARALAADPASLAEIGIFDVYDVEAAMVLDSEGARRLAAGAPINRDHHNILQTRSPGVIENGAIGRGLSAAIAAYDALPQVAMAMGAERTLEALWRQGHYERLMRLAAALRDPTLGAYARGLVASTQRSGPQAAAELRVALEGSPGLRLARARLMALQRAALVRDDPAEGSVLHPLRAEERALVAAWRALAEGQASLDALVADLAGVAPDDPLRPLADRALAEAALGAPSPADLRRGLAWLDGAMQRGQASPEDFLLRAELAHALGDLAEAVQAAEDVLPWLRQPAHARVAGGLLQLFRADDDPAVVALRERLQATLRAARRS